MTPEEFSAISSKIPTQPGIYKYFDSADELIYVGKAKHLRKRVSSYFSKTLTNYKTAELVRRIHHIEFTIVNSEHDAFLLENSLIKQYQPHFNINLKDDKTYPYIVIKNEHFPRVFFTRQKINDGSTYLGPYTSVAQVRELLDFIRQNIPLRTCKLNLSPENIRKKKFKVCLEYHLGNCLGPCEGLQSEEDYAAGLERIKHFLKGNLNPIIQEYKRQLKDHVDHLEFEKAAVIQHKLDNVKNYQSKSQVVNIRTGTVDVFSILEEGDTAYVNYLAVSEGSIIRTKTITLTKQLEETKSEVLVFAIAQLRETFESTATEIIVPFPIDYPDKEIRITIPKSGDKKNLVDLSQKNVNYFRSELESKKILQLEGMTQSETEKVLEQLQDDLHLPDLPTRIECFDNSNFQGTNAVAAMVCFINGMPEKREYRHFNIKTVEGINDFASMKEVVYRRYKRQLDEQRPLPQLVIIDGGKGQLSSAMESIEALGLIGRMTLVGLAKNQEELFFTGDSESLKLSWNSDSLKLIRRIRDEVHHFGITFHRNKRSKAAITNELESIKGIGKTTSDALLRAFKSVNNIRGLSIDELSAVIGKSKAGIVHRYFNKETSNS